MSYPFEKQDYLLADHLRVDKKDPSQIYPALLLYGCFFWVVAIAVAAFVWLLW